MTVRWLLVLVAGSASCNAIAGLDDLTFGGAPQLRCGDGHLDAPEECDGVFEESCVSLGYPGGELGCASDCRYDVSGCIAPTTPVLRFPPNGAQLGSVHRAGSLRPRFAWEPSAIEAEVPLVYELEHGTDIEVSRDRVVLPLEAATYRPERDLPVALEPPVGRRYYWRVRACAGIACSPFSATWYVDVGRDDRDLTGDGVAEIAVGAPVDTTAGEGAGAVRVYSGVQVLAEILGQPGENLGIWVSSADLDADGFGDLLVGAPTTNTGGRPGSVHVHFGDVDGIAVDPDVIVPGELPGDLFGYSVASAGDVNGDGHRDIVVGANLAGRSDTGRAYVFLGAPRASMASVAEATLEGPSAGSDFGSWVASAGDVDGDGFADVVVGASYHGAGGLDAGAAFLFRAPSFGWPSQVDGAAADRLGRAVAGGDLNGDGFSDVAVGAYQHAGVGRVYLFDGAPGAALDVDIAAAIDAPSGHTVLGRALAIGDANGDGFDDLLCGAADRAFLYYGGVGSLDGAVHDVLLGPLNVSLPGDFGRALSIGGDVDGDGIGDVLVGAPGEAANAGRVYVFQGGSDFDPANALLIDAPVGGGFFGYAVR